MLKKSLARFKGLFSRKPVSVCVCNHSSSKVLVEQVKNQDGVRNVVSISERLDNLPSSVVGVDIVKANGSHISRFLVPHTDR